VERVTEGNEMDRAESGARRNTQGASLSVVILSQGDCTDLERALACIASPCRRLDAEIIVVRAKCPDDSVSFDTAYPSVLFLEAPAASSLSERREIGISRAAGDIVAVRIDGDVSDTSWLSAFERVVVTTEELPFVERETTAKPVRDEESSAASERRRQRPVARTYAAAPSRRDWVAQAMHGESAAHLHATGEPAVARAREM
jgi:hypothetical protein